jgi:hypothetical protein
LISAFRNKSEGFVKRKQDDILWDFGGKAREGESQQRGFPFWRRKLVGGDFDPGGDRDLFGTRFYPFTLLMILQKVD